MIPSRPGSSSGLQDFKKRLDIRMADEENQRDPILPRKDKPPSYDDLEKAGLFTRVKMAKQQSAGPKELTNSICEIIFGSALLLLGCLITSAVGMAIPIAMIIIGSIYKDDCRAEPYIPLYLIVSGAFSIAFFFLSACAGDKKRRLVTDGGEDDDSSSYSCAKFLSSLISLFLLAWFIAGNVWIYGTYEPDYSNTEADDYCHKTLYLFSFWLMNATYILLGLTCCLGCLACICACCCSD
ncbi:transmembrane protein 272-like [Ptychodera flava]|uniref:transmembrane protein 272-like n=1 Tax=Ptychodera flava TaxID=63121 RepID=UPI00396A4F58